MIIYVTSLSTENDDSLPLPIFFSFPVRTTAIQHKPHHTYYHIRWALVFIVCTVPKKCSTAQLYFRRELDSSVPPFRRPCCPAPECLNL